MSSNVSGSDALQSLEEIVIRNNISRYLTGAFPPFLTFRGEPLFEMSVY